MRLNAPPERSTRSLTADWVELYALLNPPAANELSLIRSLTIQQESEHGGLRTVIDDELIDEEILESKNDELSERTYEELAYRERVLGSRYPFELYSLAGNKWALRRRSDKCKAEKAAHDCYICCLLISAIHSELLPTKSDHKVFKSSAKALQVSSYLTAAEVLGGQAYWFGFPRPDGSGMLEAIQKLAAAMGTAVAPKERPLALSNKAADGTVDIVAWRPFLDGQAASIVAYGQVASGRNWKDKPIKDFIDSRFLSWFDKKPSHKHIEMLFVPFPQHHEQQEDRKYDFRKIASEKARLREMDFGVVIDRLRLTELMALSKVGDRYDAQDYDEHERFVLAWIQDALTYAGGIM